MRVKGKRGRGFRACTTAFAAIFAEGFSFWFFVPDI